MTDHNLDPAAVEAAAKALSDAFVPWGDDWTTETIAAITAYQQAMAAQVREAVVELMSAQGNVIVAYHNDSANELDDLRRHRDNARTALLRLVGATETEAEQ